MSSSLRLTTARRKASARGTLVLPKASGISFEIFPLWIFLHHVRFPNADSEAAQSTLTPTLSSTFPSWAMACSPSKMLVSDIEPACIST